MGLMFDIRGLSCWVVILLIGLHIQDTDQKGEGNGTSNHVGTVDVKTNDTEKVSTEIIGRKGDESTKSTSPLSSTPIKVTSSFLASESSEGIAVTGDRTPNMEPETESVKEKSMWIVSSSAVRSSSFHSYPSFTRKGSSFISTSSGKDVLFETHNGVRHTTSTGTALKTHKSLDPTLKTVTSTSERGFSVVENVERSSVKSYSIAERLVTKLGSNWTKGFSASEATQSIPVSQHKNGPKETGQHNSFGEYSSVVALSLILPSSGKEHVSDTTIASPTLRYIFQSSSYLNFFSTAKSDERGSREDSKTGFSLPSSSAFSDYAEMKNNHSARTIVVAIPSTTVSGEGEHSGSTETHSSSLSLGAILSITSTHALSMRGNTSPSATPSVAVFDSAKQVSSSTHLSNLFDSSTSLDLLTRDSLSARTASSPSELIKGSDSSSTPLDIVITFNTSSSPLRSATSHYPVVFTSRSTSSPIVEESKGTLVKATYELASFYTSNMTSTSILTANTFSLNKTDAYSVTGTLSCGGSAMLYCQTAPVERISFSPQSTLSSMPGDLSNASLQTFSSLNPSASVSSSQSGRPHLTWNLSASFSLTPEGHTSGDSSSPDYLSTSWSSIANASTQGVHSSSLYVAKPSILFSSSSLQMGESASLSTHAMLYSKLSVHLRLGSSLEISSFTSMTPVQWSKEVKLVNSTCTSFVQSKTKSPMVLLPLTTVGFIGSVVSELTTAFSPSRVNIETSGSAKGEKTTILIHPTATYPRGINISSATVSRVTIRPTTDPSTTVPTTKARLEYVPSVLLGRTKTTIAVQLDMSSFNFERALKIDILIQRYGLRTSDFDGITALPPVTWFKVHYVVRYSYRRYIAASICISSLHCNRGLKAGFGVRSRHRRQLRNGLLVFRAGEEKGCEYRQGQSDYCNGPLEPDTKYRFQILIHYTDSSHISTTPFSKPIITIASGGGVVTPTEKGTSSSNQTTLIIGIIVVLIIILLIILGFVILSRKRNARRGPYGHNGELNCALISTFRSHSNCSCTQTGAVEQGFPLRPISKGMSRPVSVKDFHAWVQRSAADSDFRFAEEFESIRDVGRDQAHEASDMPENRGKNRYVNVLAYDHTRVKLSYTDDEAGSDYINANYIHGYKQPRAYIATQGPLPGTTDDFWRMVWEQNSRLIVMITQLTERTRVKCHKYWPGSEPTTYGDITVSLASDFSFPNWCEREFMLELEGEEPRRIHQYQYNSWPDHGVPKTTSDILEFQSTVQAHCLSTHGPIIVHCSAGVGRTGTFIAIDTIIKRLQEETVVDVYGTVCLMRLQRCSMVQTEDQYIYIHRVVLEYIEQREMNTHIFKGYSLLPLEERDLLESDRGSEDDSLTPASPLLGENSIDVAFNASPVTGTERETSLL